MEVSSFAIRARGCGEVNGRVALPLLGHDFLVAFDELVAGSVAATGREVPHHRELDLNEGFGPWLDRRRVRLAPQHSRGVDDGADDGRVGRTPADVSGELG